MHSVALDSPFDPLEPISVALIDIRAGLEAQLRLLTAAQVCVEYRRSNPTCDALDNCAAYLDRILHTNKLLVAALTETASAARETAAGSAES
jgi:hypothetical protein